jgi:hypothetical protein
MPATILTLTFISVTLTGLKLLRDLDPFGYLLVTL